MTHHPLSFSDPHTRFMKRKVNIIRLSVVLTLGALYIGVALVPSLFSAPTWTILPVAMVPLALLVVFFRQLDRWEPESWSDTVLAICWGAFLATVVAGYLNSHFQHFLTALYSEEEGARLTAIFCAPIVEETLKGAFVLWLYHSSKTRLHSLMDGVYYTGIVAAAFAAVENVMYFLSPFTELSDQLTAREQQTYYASLVFHRAVLSTFTHPMATTLIGLAAAYAFLYYTQVGQRIAIIFGGWVAAVLVHGAWNWAASTLRPGQWYLSYVLVAIPAWIVWAVIMVRLSQRDKRLLCEGLQRYMYVNALTSQEYALATDRHYRNAALVWARSVSEQARTTVLEMIQVLVEIGMSAHPHYWSDFERRTDLEQRLAKLQQLRDTLAIEQQRVVQPYVQSPTVR